jgi:hypothetical protein
LRPTSRPVGARAKADKAVYRSVEDPNLVLVMHRLESKEQGDTFMSNPDLIEAQRQAGVDLESVRLEAHDED